LFLKEWILNGHTEWKNNVYGQCKSWLDNGLQPRAMTRDSNWGIKVPLTDAAGKVLYVWFDAPIGYISVTKELRTNWAGYRRQPDTKLLHYWQGQYRVPLYYFPAMPQSPWPLCASGQCSANEFLNIKEKSVYQPQLGRGVHGMEDFPGCEVCFGMCSAPMHWKPRIKILPGRISDRTTANWCRFSEIL
jgi:methionyl-tRNA synthetase